MFKRNVCIVFEGAHLNGAINALSAMCPLYGVRKQGGRCSVMLPSRCFEQAVDFLRKRCYNVVETSPCGAYALGIFMRRHFLLPVFLAVTAAAVLLLSNVCFKVEVYGDYTAREVKSALDGCALGEGRLLYGFSSDKAENYVANTLDAAYVSVQRRGSVLYVSAYRRQNAQPPVDMHVRRDVTANFDGIVTRIVCQQGTAAVSAGDRVKKGDVLVYGLRTFSDGSVEQVYAVAEVTMRLSVSAFVPFYGSVEKAVDSGRTFTCNFVELFGKRYGKQPPFEKFRYTVTTNTLAFNVKVHTVTFYEQFVERVPASIDAVREKLCAEALDAATKKAFFPISDTRYEVTEKGVTCVVSGEVKN